MWPKTSFFEQNDRMVEQKLRADLASMGVPMRDDPPLLQKVTASPEDRIRSWANDISDCMNAMAGVDTGKYSHKTFANAMGRLDEIVREMDTYGTR